MVSNVMSYGRNGLADWIVQRVTALMMIVYGVIWDYVIFTHRDNLAGYIPTLFAHRWFKIATVLALLAILAHAWIGIWTVLTDYVKCHCGRLFLQVMLILVLLGYLLWGLSLMGG